MANKKRIIIVSCCELQQYGCTCATTLSTGWLAHSHVPLIPVHYAGYRNLIWNLLNVEILILWHKNTNIDIFLTLRHHKTFTKLVRTSVGGNIRLILADCLLIGVSLNRGNTLRHYEILCRVECGFHSFSDCADTTGNPRVLHTSAWFSSSTFDLIVHLSGFPGTLSEQKATAQFAKTPLIPGNSLRDELEASWSEVSAAFSKEFSRSHKLFLLVGIIVGCFRGCRS